MTSKKSENQSGKITPTSVPRPTTPPKNNSMDQESFDTYKNAQLDIIWAKLEEIYTNIEYSSLKAASEKSNVQKRIIVALIVINAIYSSVCFYIVKVYLSHIHLHILLLALFTSLEAE